MTAARVIMVELICDVCGTITPQRESVMSVRRDAHRQGWHTVMGRSTGDISDLCHDCHSDLTVTDRDVLIELSAFEAGSADWTGEAVAR
jgi:hypothetical protein